MPRPNCTDGFTRCAGLEAHLTLVILLLVMGSGCQQKDRWERVVVSGTVTHNEQPVVTGRIRFEPIAGTAGPVSVAVIKDGSYRYDRLGGVPLGSHRVRIYASDPNDTAGGGPGGPPPRELIPPQYNAHSTLMIKLDGKKKGEVHSFDLK